MASWSVFAVGALVAAVASPASAQSADARGWVEVGAHRAKLDSQVRYDSSSTISGTELDMEEDLGLKSRATIPHLRAGMRIGEPWRVEVEAYALDRKASFDPFGAGGIDFGGTTFDAEIDSRLRTITVRLSGGYSFVLEPEREFGVSAGLHVTDFLVRVRGSGTENGQTVTSVDKVKKQTVPMPMLGVFGRQSVAPALSIDGRLDGFAIDIGSYEGKLLVAEANLRWQAAPRFNVALGWRYEDIKLDGDGSRFHGKLHTKANGPQLLAGFEF